MGVHFFGKGNATPPSWSTWVAIHHADDAGIHPRADFVQSLRSAHADDLCLAKAAEVWRQSWETDELADAFEAIQNTAANAVNRIEHVMAGLQCSARGGSSSVEWLDDAASQTNTERITAAHRLLDCLTQTTLRVERLAHDLGEYQATRLLRMSADEYADAAERLPSPRTHLTEG